MSEVVRTVTDMGFGDFLRSKRKQMKFSQLEFADKLGIDPNTVSRWELGKSAPPIDLAKDIIISLGGELQIIADRE